MLMGGLFWEVLMLPISIAAAQWGIGVAAIGWIWMMIAEKKLKFSLGVITLPTACYIGICIITSAFAERTGHALASVWDNEWLLFSAIMLVSAKPTAKELQRILLFFVVAGIFGAAFGIVQHFTGIRWHGTKDDLFIAYYIGQKPTYRSLGFFSHTLSYSSVMALLFFLIAGLLIAGYRQHKKMFIAGLVFVAAALFVSYSRGTWISIGLTAIGLALVSQNTKARRAILAAIMLGIICCAFVPQVRDRITHLGNSDPGNVDRQTYWNIAMQIARDHPVMGIGADNWDLFYPRYKPPEPGAPLSFPDHPHNEYLNVLTSAGIFGLLAYLWMWGALLKAAIKKMKNEHHPLYHGILIGGAAGIFSVLIAQFTQDIFHDFTDQLTWWFITGLVLVAINRTESSDPQITNSATL